MMCADWQRRKIGAGKAGGGAVQARPPHRVSD